MVKLNLDEKLKKVPLGMQAFVFPRSRIKLGVMPLSCGHEYRVPNDGYTLDGLARGNHEFFIFQYTLAGRGAMEYEGEYKSLQPGEAMLLRIPHRHRYFLPPDSEFWNFVYLCVHGTQAKAILNEILVATGPVMTIADRQKTSLEKLYEILISSTKNADLSPFKASAMTYDFVMTLADEMIPSGGRRNWSDPVEDAVAYAQRNYRQQIGVHDLATAAGLSQSYFSRRFTREVGISPYQYLIELRVRELGQRLLQSEETLEKIALDLGFCDANHLCKCFKAATGTTPGEFRRRA